MSGRTFLMQDWVTIRSSLSSPFVQDPIQWLDLNGFSDVTCWIDVVEVTPPAGTNTNSLQFAIQTSPTADDAYFASVGQLVNYGTATPFQQASATPFLVRSATSATSNNLARYLRWQITPSTSGAWDITFRIRAVASRSPTFVPTLLPNCVFWVRADLGVTLNGANVSAWADLSGLANTATQATSTRQPAYNVRQINNQPTIYFDPTTVGSEKYMSLASSLASVTAAHGFVVHRRITATESVNSRTGFWKFGTSAGTAAMPGTDGNIYDDFATTSNPNTGTPVVTLTTAQVYEVQSTSGSWKSFGNGIAQFSQGTNTVGASTTPQIGGNSAWPNYYYGDWAEMIMYGRVLTTAERARVIGYLNGRYALGAV